MADTDEDRRHCQPLPSSLIFIGLVARRLDAQPARRDIARLLHGFIVQQYHPVQSAVGGHVVGGRIVGGHVVRRAARRRRASHRRARRRRQVVRGHVVGSNTRSSRRESGFFSSPTSTTPWMTSVGSPKRRWRAPDLPRRGSTGGPALQQHLRRRRSGDGRSVRTRIGGRCVAMLDLMGCIKSVAAGFFHTR